MDMTCSHHMVILKSENKNIDFQNKNTYFFYDFILIVLL